MSELPSSAGAPRRRRWLKVLLLATGALLVLAALFAIFFVPRLPSHEEEVRAGIESRLAALRAIGAPLTMADLARLYPDPPPEHDAMILLSPALGQLSVPYGLNSLPILGEAGFPRGSAPLDERLRTEIWQLLETNRPALLAAEQTDLNGAWFANGFSGSITNYTGLPTTPLMQLAKLLCLDAALKAEGQHGADGSRSLIRAFQIGRTCRSPAMIWHFRRMAMDGAACTTLQRFLNCTELTEPDLGVLAAGLAEDPPKDLKEVFAVELASELNHIQQWRGMATQMVNKAWTPIGRLMSKYVAQRMYRDQEFLSYLEWQGGLFASFKLSSRQQLDWLATNKPPAKPKNPKESSMAMIFIMPMPNLVRLEAQGLATLRLARTAIAIERWRLAHEKRLPDSLTDLVPSFLPAVPADPFDDQPIRYKKLPSGYVVYSFGADFTDNAGKEPPVKPKDGEHYDITFTVER